MHTISINYSQKSASNLTGFRIRPTERFLIAKRVPEYEGQKRLYHY